jgi:5-methylcytosine-specific restriction protein B
VLAFESSKVLGIGKVTGPYEYDASPRIPHRRPVRWLSTEEWVPPQQETKGSAVREVKHLENLLSAEKMILYGSGPTPPGGNGRPLTAGSLDQLADKTNLTRPELQELKSMLEQKRQVILEGPPGSGKTYVAELFARYFTDNPLEGEADDRLVVVQFHQSYGYEDFVQGIRPVTNELGQLEYRVQDGIFKRLCTRAEKDKERNYVILIDEINRGNISRIFGELLLLLEYRDRQTLLPYARPNDPLFSIPPNVYLIGTMNTTDRSLAQIDYALRRRFYFYRLSPVVDGQAPVLARWLEKQDLSPDARQQLLELFVKLNGRVQQELGEHFQVGHSYLMEPGIESRTLQERVWRRAILPLLDEYFYNRRNRDELLAGFGLEALLDETSGTPDGAE